MKSISNLFLNKLSAVIIIAAVAGLVSINAFAHNYEPMGFGGFQPFGGFGYGYGFGGYGMDFGYSFAGFGHGMDFGGFHHFGGHHSDVHFAGDFGGFGHGFTVQNTVHASSRKIVPLPPTASAVNTSISYDENGELHVRPFDDEDLFVED